MFSKLLFKNTTKPGVLVVRNIFTSQSRKIRDDPYKVFMHYNNRKEHDIKNVEKAFIVGTILCIGSAIVAWTHEWDDIMHPWKHRPKYVPYVFYWSSYSKRFPWGEFPIMFNIYKNFTRDGYLTDDEGNLIKQPTTYP